MKKENKTKNAKVKKPLLKRWWVRVAIFMLLLFVLIPKGGEKNANPYKEGGEDKAHEYTCVLCAGHYTVGLDIPYGICDVKAVSGRGILLSSNYNGKKGIRGNFGFGSSGELLTEFSDLDLSENDKLSVGYTLCVELHYASVKEDFEARSYNESAAVTIKGGTYIVGTDFPAATYKIAAMEGTGFVSTANLTAENGGLNEFFGADASDDAEAIAVFFNAELAKGVQLSIGKGLTVKLVPVIE